MFIVYAENIYFIHEDISIYFRYEGFYEIVKNTPVSLEIKDSKNYQKKTRNLS